MSARDRFQSGELLECLVNLGFPFVASFAAEPVELNDHERVVGEGWKRVPTGAAEGFFSVGLGGRLLPAVVTASGVMGMPMPGAVTGVLLVLRGLDFIAAA
jgi:hypothetical protein